MVQYGPALSRMVKYGPAWLRVVPHDPAWSRMVLHGPVWPVWPCMAPYGPIWSHMLPYAPVWYIMTQYFACLFPIWFCIIPHGPVLPSGVLYDCMTWVCPMWSCISLHSLIGPCTSFYFSYTVNIAWLRLTCSVILTRFSSWILLFIFTCGQSEKSLSQNKIQQIHLSAAKDPKLHKISKQESIK